MAGRDLRTYVERFEHAAAHAALRLGLDGAISGPIHRPAVRELGGILRCNDGDRVEHCTALVEDCAGRIDLVAWTESGVPARSGGPGRLAALETAARVRAGSATERPA